MPPDVMAQLKSVIQALNEPLSSADTESEWIEDSRRAMTAYFVRVEDALTAGQRPPNVPDSIRGLDAWGIRSGPLFERILALVRTWPRDRPNYDNCDPLTSSIPAGQDQRAQDTGTPLLEASATDGLLC